MNITLWVLSGGLLGSVLGLYFSSSTFILMGDVISGILGAILAGRLSVSFVSNTPVKEWGNGRLFSPGAILWAIAGAILTLTLFNWLF